GACPVCQLARQGVVLIKGTEDPATPVVVDDHRTRGPAGYEHAGRDRCAIAGGQGDLTHAGHIWTLAVQLCHARPSGPGVIRCQFVQWGKATRCQPLEQSGARLIKHRVLLEGSSDPAGREEGGRAGRVATFWGLLAPELEELAL